MECLGYHKYTLNAGQFIPIRMDTDESDFVRVEAISDGELSFFILTNKGYSALKSGMKPLGEDYLKRFRFKGSVKEGVHLSKGVHYLVLKNPASDGVVSVEVNVKEL